MKAVRKVAAGPGFELQEIPVPEVASDEVLVQVEAASIFGTDIHILNWDEWSAQRVDPPLTIGHEFAGTVVEAGARVEHVKVGDYVSAESHVTCGMCFQCRTGQAHVCPSTRILGVDLDGAFAEYVALPEKVIWQNDREKMPPEIATLQEPFGNAVLAALAHNLAGQSVAVLGCGPIGLFSIGIARASGASKVLAVDLNDFRLSLGKTMGADAVLNASDAGEGDAVADWLVEANEGFGVDIVLEMSGAASAVNAALKGVRDGGRVTLFGIPSKPVTIDGAGSMIFKNLTTLALSGRRIFDTWYKTRWILESGLVNVRPLITREIGLEDFGEAVALLSSGQASKIVLRVGQGGEAAKSSAAHEQADPNIRGQVVHR